MKKIILSLIFIFSITNLFAQDSLKICSATRVNKAPKIDGKLDDDAWLDAIATSSFTQTRPIENTKPNFVTEVKITYDNTAIYVGAFMHDSAPDSILHELGSRDNYDLNADLFEFKIDPYLTHQDAFIFSVFASGVQGDNKFSDYTFNAVWSSAVSINDRGWVVEMKIPYSAIRFPKKEIQKWGLQFTRNVRRTREFDQWAYTPSGSGNPLIFWGSLQGITSIKTPVRLSLTPYLSGYLENSSTLAPDGKLINSNSASYNAGADIKYGIDDRFTLDMTLLPDFGQVQSDNKIKNLGFREVTYDENRSFFREGTDLFSKNNLFYSRRIGKIPSGYFNVYNTLREGDSIISNPQQVKLINAAKISGRTNSGLGLGIFNAVTANMYASIQDSTRAIRKQLTEPQTNYNIIVLDQQLKNNSSIYFINTNVIRDKTFSHANVTGAGFTLSNKQNSYAIDGNGTFSQKLSLIDSQTQTYSDKLGYKYFLGARKSSGRTQFGIGHQVSNSSIYTSDLGYQSIPNVVNTNFYIQRFLFKPYKIFRDANSTLSSNYATNFVTKQRTNFELNFNLYATLMSYNGISGGGGITPISSLDYNEPRIPGRYAKTLRFFYAYIGFNSDPRKAVAFDINQTVSNFLDHFKTEGYNTDVGIRYRASDKLNMKYNFSFYYDPFNFGFADIDSANNVIYGGRKLYTYINRLSINYIFKNDMTLSLIGRHYWNTGEYLKYFTIQDDGSYAENYSYKSNNDFSYNAFNVDVVYAWRFAPGSQFSLVYKNNIETEETLQNSKFGDNFTHTINAPQTNSLSLKVLYYLDYLYLRKKSESV